MSEASSPKYQYLLFHLVQSCHLKTFQYWTTKLSSEVLVALCRDQTMPADQKQKPLWAGQQPVKLCLLRLSLQPQLSFNKSCCSGSCDKRLRPALKELTVSSVFLTLSNGFIPVSICCAISPNETRHFNKFSPTVSTGWLLLLLSPQNYQNGSHSIFMEPLQKHVIENSDSLGPYVRLRS